MTSNIDAGPWVSIQDEGGKIDLNTAPDELLKGLFLSIGLDGDASAVLVDAVADFRDEDSLRRINGAEDDDYLGFGLGYGAKDGPFQTVAELQQVMGITQEIYERVAPALTVYSRQRGIDPRVAPREALLALPEVGSDDIDSLLAARAEQGEPAVPVTTEHQTASRQRVFTIRAEAHTVSGAVFVREAIVEPLGDRDGLFRILAWRRGDIAIVKAAPDG